MRRRFEIIKTIQLLLLIVVTAVGLIILFTDDAFYQLVGHDPSARILCILLWLTLGLSFGFVLWDFGDHSATRKSYTELDFAVFNDRVSGIANRYSCDAMIERYIDKPLPETLGCVMLDLTSLRAINDSLGHAAGNEAIRVFSDMLHNASLGICFVGRNGGNKFMALFEDCTDEKIGLFLTRVDRMVTEYNAAEGNAPLEYRTGSAFSREENVKTVTQLIALSDRRLSSKTDDVTGFSNRASCDDIISLYLDRELPDNVGCIMIDMTNIREINEARGHRAGNAAIRDFGDILREASADLCFVGRNGGTKFLALFEDCTDEKMDSFLQRIAARVETNNASDTNTPLMYRYGRAFREGKDVASINALLALADRRSRGEA